ncbi:DNA polymerase III subunit delta [Thiolapillus sp.]|uniref:DNA polymerase III subunit delta n=1 Tax=Thiolapillus sp. TaxID=2017437 RepID=UPI003AF9CC71
MRLRQEQLDAHLAGNLAPVYVVTGDEPLQLGETADAIRAAARQAGYLSREIFEADARFDWNRLGEEASALSLFAEQKIIDLRLPTGKPGTVGSKVLVTYCENLPADTLLLLTLPKLPLTSKWMKALDKVGMIIQVWPVDERQLPRWVQQRMRMAGLQAEAGVAEMLAEQTEGNLLAARQEIEKLALLFGNERITQAQAAAAISDCSRFDVYSLVDAALAGKTRRSIRIITGLKAEGIPLPVVLWALAREVRTLNAMAQDIAAGASVQQALGRARVWKNRIPLVSAGLKRLDARQWAHLLQQCQLADATIKGAAPGDPWLLLEQIALGIAGISAPGQKLINY